MTFAYWYCKVQAVAIEHNLRSNDYRAICNVLPEDLINALLEGNLTDPNAGKLSPGNKEIMKIFEEELIERILLK